MDESTEQLVARVIGRPLDTCEIGTYPNMDALPPAVTELVAIVTMRHNSVLAARYLFERVRGSASYIGDCVELFTEQWMSRWTSADEVNARNIIGRELTANELATVEGSDLPSEVTEITSKLAARDFTLGCKYLLQRVPDLRLSTAMSWLGRLVHVE